MKRFDEKEQILTDDDLYVRMIEYNEEKKNE